MLSTYPSASQRILGAQASRPLVRPNVIVIHTMVGSLKGTDGWFRSGNGRGFDGTESHFGVGHSSDGPLDGAVWQWQDLGFRADAQLEGNHRAWSIECSDGGKITSFSPKQLTSLIELVTWLCKNGGIPPALVKSTVSTESGIGYHAQGIHPNRRWDGEYWSRVRGKTCPGAPRIKQIKEVVISRVYAALHGYPSTGGEGGVKKPSPIKTVPARIFARLVVDGDFGPRTFKALQKALKVGQDGLMGPKTTKALQRALKVPQTGRVDTTTILAAQRRFGVKADGVWGPLTTKALQRALNAGKL